MDAAQAHLLDFSKPFDITLLDQLVGVAYDGSHPQRLAAEESLVRMKQHPDMWKRADAILETSKQDNTKFFGLQVLGDAVDFRWKTLAVEHREGIRNYIIGKIIALATTDESMTANHVFLSRLNLVLVQILKQDWPHNWPSFIGDLVGASKTSECLCENNMKILQLLSEEVFDFSKDSMTAAKIILLKESLNKEFSQIFQLCEFILDASQKRSLVQSTLVTLQRFLSWIPLGYIFETGLITGLIGKFLPVAHFRTKTVDCLTEIANLPASDIAQQYHGTLHSMLSLFITQLVTIIPRDANLVTAFDNGTDEECLFIQRLALFLGTFLKTHLKSFEVKSATGEAPIVECEAVVVEALMYMVRISEVDDEEIFKTCIEFWHHFSKDVYTAESHQKSHSSGLFYGSNDFNNNCLGDESMRSDSPVMGMVRSRSSPNIMGECSSLSDSTNGGLSHTSRYSNILHRLRNTIIDKMAKPEEVIIVEDDNGGIIREMTKDTEVIAQYKTMREIIVYLTNLNYDETELLMLGKLELQVDGGQFSWNGLNTLCWAIGSISGSMSENDEKRFLVTVIKDLLRLCEEQKGKDNKAVVASNIMYIVGQYPRFLRAHWKFLKTVVTKLFEFMHELHPGVQDMACDTFLKIAQKCKRKFVTLQLDETQPFILTLIANMRRHTADLQSHQVQSFYESVGTMLSDKGPAIQMSREDAIIRLMDIPNAAWSVIMTQAAQNIQNLYQLEAIRELSKALRINNRVCSSVGSIYVHQLSTIFLDMMNIYRLFSEQIIAACVAQGEYATRVTQYKEMRRVKSDILDLMCVFLEQAHDLDGGPQMLLTSIIPSLMTETLKDYKLSPAGARDARVLKLFATMTSVLKSNINSEIPRIMEGVFETTLEMITKNMLDFPDHRTEFFHFLHEANEHCFYGLFSIPTAHQKLVIDSIVWAFKHTERNISESGLEILQNLLNNMEATPQISSGFYQMFLTSLIQDILHIMTDRLHKSGFKLQAEVLQHIFYLISTSKIAVPLYDASLEANRHFVDNKQFVEQYVATQLRTVFPNISLNQAVQFVQGLFQTALDTNAFKQHVRDFLITVKEFQTEDNSELFTEETELNLERMREEQLQYRSSVPGLLAPVEQPQASDDL